METSLGRMRYRNSDFRHPHLVLAMMSPLQTKKKKKEKANAVCGATPV